MVVAVVAVAEEASVVVGCVTGHTQTTYCKMRYCLAWHNAAFHQAREKDDKVVLECSEESCYSRVQCL